MVAEATNLGPSYEASVVLDVGGDVGALVLYTSEVLLGAEIEISPIGDSSARTHTAVRERRLKDATLYAAVYPQLQAGLHTLWADSRHEAGTVTVIGGVVTEIQWSELSSDAGHHEHHA